MDNWNHPTGRTPEKVIMLLLGESKRQYADVHSTSHNRIFPPGHEVWTCNAGFRIWRHDLLFVMDDLEGERHKWPDYGGDLARHDRPIITSTPYADWANACAYPLESICEALKLTGLDRYFYNTVPYMLAYALYIGVKQVTIFGADYWHPAVPQAREADLANTEWWLGFLRAKGVNIVLASDTTLMRAREPGRPLYGYRHDPRAAIDKAKAAAINRERTYDGEDEIDPIFVPGKDYRLPDSVEDERPQHLDKEQWGGWRAKGVNIVRLPPIKRLLRLLSCTSG